MNQLKELAYGKGGQEKMSESKKSFKWIEQKYLDDLYYLINNGEKKSNRTGIDTYSAFSTTYKFPIDQCFPAITTKKLAFKSVVSELLWMLEGSGDDNRLKEIHYGSKSIDKNTIWTANAQSDYWKNKAKWDGDLGRVYGVQWRSWRGAYGIYVDQVQKLLNNLKNNPFDRRHIITAWNPAELDQMALPPCHMFMQFYVDTENGLHSSMYQRSCDMFLGVPFNIASYSLLTCMIAHVLKMKPKTFNHILGDYHIYENHIEQVKEQLTREPLEPPTLWLNPEVDDLFKFKMDDIKLVDYNSHSTIKADMAV